MKRLSAVYAAFYHAAVPIFVIDRDGTITDANAVFTGKYLELHSSILGANIFRDMASRPSAQPFYEKRKAAVEMVFASRQFASIQEIIDGKCFLRSMYPSLSRDGTVDKCFIVTQDISEQYDLLERFREQESHWDITSESCRLGLWKLDLKKMAIMTTAEHDRIFGVEPYSIKWTPRSFFKMIASEDRRQVGSIVRNSFTARSDDRFECRIRRRDGSTRWLSVFAKHQFDRYGKLTHLFGVTQDITEKKELETRHEELQQQLHQSQKMELLGQLAGGIAHDINNVLTTIQGNTDLILDGMPETNPHHQNLFSITNSVKRSTEMVGQLLAFARKQPISPQFIELDGELKRIHQMLGKLIRQNISLHLHLQCPHLLVKIDPSNLVQIVTNLCINARDAIAEAGSISIDTSVVAAKDSGNLQRVASGTSGEYATITISDNGAGIDKQVVPHIFEPFFTTKAIGAGTGLGLSTVYGLVKQNNGHIACRTKIGKGTTFEVFFPIASNTALASSAPDTLEPICTERSRGTILVVEDEPDIAKIIRIVLQNEGFTVFIAKDAAEAFSITNAIEGYPCLVVSDIMLPGMNGVQMSRKLLASKPDMKFLFMSGYSAETLGEFGTFDPDTNFISKPFSLIRFVNLVNTILKQKA
ncbi:MAG: response regulator [Chlorobiaceae bacterium]|nr:response regulator [Chlorobiaceae bacterium]